jgi:hypothetical protein
MKRIYGGAVGTTFVVVMLQGCVGDDPGASSEPAADGGATPPVIDGGRPPDLAPDAAPPALCPLGCLPPAPTEWTGPSAVYDGVESGKPADCPSPYTVKEVETHVGLTAAAPSCTCGNAQVKDRTCTTNMGGFSDSNCTNSTFLLGKASSAAPCLKTTDTNSSHYKLTTPTLVPGTCTYPDKVFAVPAIAFERVEVACGLPQAAACDTRPDCVASPVPAQPYTRLCIHHEGDVSCPSADYAVKVLAFKKFDDTRACSECPDGVPTGGACGNNFGQTVAEAQCLLSSPSDKTLNTCYPYSAGILVNTSAMGPSAGTCPAQAGGQPTGTAASLEPVTFCCNR